MVRLLTKVLLLSGLAACAGGSRATPVMERSSDPMLARRRLWSVVDTLVVNRSAAIARYGPPVTVVADTVRMLATPDVLDSGVTIRFRTFVAYYHVYPDGRTELWHVTIAVPGTTVPSAAEPGASRRSLVDYLGPPDDESSEPEGLLLLYKMCGSDEDCNVMNILLVDDRVRWISWVFFPNEPSWPPH